jgi:hypothetical protein
MARMMLKNIRGKNDDQEFWRVRTMISTQEGKNDGLELRMARTMVRNSGGQERWERNIRERTKDQKNGVGGDKWETGRVCMNE